MKKNSQISFYFTHFRGASFSNWANLLTCLLNWDVFLTFVAEKQIFLLLTQCVICMGANFYIKTSNWTNIFLRILLFVHLKDIIEKNSKNWWILRNFDSFRFSRTFKKKISTRKSQIFWHFLILFEFIHLKTSMFHIQERFSSIEE